MSKRNDNEGPELMFTQPELAVHKEKKILISWTSFEVP